MTITIGSGITVGAGVAVTPAPASIVTDGLILHYDFSNPASYPGSGTAITDLSPATNNGTVVNDYSAISYVADGQTSYFNWSTNAGGSEPLQGNIGQALIYNRALTTAEIQQNYTAVRSRYGV